MEVVRQTVEVLVQINGNKINTDNIMATSRFFFLLVVIFIGTFLHSVRSAQKVPGGSHKLMRATTRNPAIPPLQVQQDTASFSSIIAAAARGGSRGAVNAAVVAKPLVIGDVVAKVLGYIIGAGSMAVYLPILLSLLKGKSADGFSAQTWVFNLLGISLACVYPIKKMFPLSTYVELILLAVQSIGILGLICFYQQLTKEYLIFMLVFAFATFATTVTPIPSKVLQATQMAAILVCNYANIPQIILTFRRKKASWSPITAAMSMAGNLIRIFTTFQLAAGDKLILGGYVLGFTTNAILLAQVLFYGSADSK